MRWIKNVLPFSVLLWALAACDPVPLSAPTPVPFPTMTLGAQLEGNLSAPSAPDIAAPNLSNPATVVAIASAPTATPDASVCPAPRGEVTLDSRQETPDSANEALLRYLNNGGTLRDLNAALRLRWRQTGNPARADVDLLGGGQAAVTLAYRAPGDLGLLVVFACLNGRYQLVHSLSADGDEAPQVLFAGEMNNSAPAELMVARRICLTADDCEYETQVLSWSPRLGRFVNLLETPLRSLSLPQARDADQDQVLEIVVNLESRGTSQTGPLRTGVHIYDWDGALYTLSIIQLDPPRWTIQVIHEGDKAFSRQDFLSAESAYRQALEADLRAWFNDDAQVLRAYALYRLILSYAALSDARINDVYGVLGTEFGLTPEVDPESLPTFALMAYRFVESFERSQDLHRACVDTLSLAEQRGDALRLLNRYGSRSPSYAVLDLCPF